MRLKRLDISGFKTFPDKSAIEFPPGISAIVGPNGCGKSNIFDAIKWVMGEQSIKQLRGKSMGDVIFAGTDKRAPVNMAEVSLTLTRDGTENSEEARHSYAEIMITRRLYRSGETAYLLNRQPCRLKDIHNIFLGAGMGSKSCAIVQQGNIGAITEASAEERRSFIEEAAGVMRYKTRRKEALAKVETTRQNLERLNDIIDEIQQQLSGLSQQADAAREYKRLQSRLKENEVQIAVYYYTNYARQIENAESRLKALSEKDETHTETLEELNARREAMQAETADREAAISEKRTQIAEKQRRIDKLEGDRDYREQEKQRLTDELGDLQASLQNLIEKNEKLEAEITEEEESEEQLTAAIASIQSALDQQTKKSRDIRQQRDSFQEALEDQQNRLMELSAYKARYQNICQNARANQENLKKRLKRLHTDEAESLEAVEDLSRTESEEKGQLEERVRQRDALHEQVTEARRVLAAKNDSLGKQVKTVNTLSNERSRLRSRYSALKKMEDNYEWYRDGVKFIMRHPEKIAAAEQGRNSPIRGIIADFVTPEPGYALALEACLGEALQFILVTETQTGRDWIDYLREKEAGRCGFLPLQPNSAENESPGDGDPQADYLVKHLSVRTGFEASIHKLLGGALVAGDVEEALKLREIHPRATVVTPQGDLITSSGAMVGGSANKLSGIYEKKQEIRDLDRKITDLSETITKEEALQAGLEKEIREIETRLHEMGSRQTEAEKAVVQLEKDLYKTAERLKHARRQHEIVCLEKERLEGEKEDIESEIQTHDTALEEIKQDIAAADAAVNETREKMDELSEQIKSFDQQEVDLKLDKTRIQAELDSARTTLKRLRQFSDDSAAQIEAARADIEVKTEKQSAAAETIDSLSAAIAEAQSELESLKDSLKSEEKFFHSLVRELKATDNTISKTRQHLSRAQEERHQIELDLSRYRVNQENVVNRFLERYADSFVHHVSQYQETVSSPDFSIDRLEAERTEHKAAMEALGDVNLGAIDAYDKQKERHDFFVKHRDDLENALNDLQNLIQRINRITQKLFTETFSAVNEKFRELFPRLFEGGEAWLELTQPNNALETGVELLIHPPGKKVSRLSLLSGGEKALSAIAFIFAIFLINPASYCLLDEIDAPLDEVNIHRFNELLKIIGEKSQIIMVTHNKKSMEFAEMLYGVTMGENGVSRIVSVDVDKILADKSDASVSSQDLLEMQ